LFLFTFYYLKNIHITWRSILLGVIFFLSLIFFNIWRVFSLVYIYSVLQMQQFGDTIHIALGMIGFTVSCLLLHFLAKLLFFQNKTATEKKAFSKIMPPKGVQERRFVFGRFKSNFILLMFLFLFLIGGEGVIFLRKGTKNAAIIPQKNYHFVLKDYDLKEVLFTLKESAFLVNRDVDFSKKFEGKTKSGIPFSLLIVSSKSWKSHHNPEVCLQGLGYQLGTSEILQVDKIVLRKIQLKNDQGEVLYWFNGKEKTLSDYSERVWEGILNPQQSWTLIEVGFDRPINLKTTEMKELLVELNAAAKTFF
jgi:exosortase O